MLKKTKYIVGLASVIAVVGLSPLICGIIMRSAMIQEIEGWN